MKSGWQTSTRCLSLLGLKQVHNMISSKYGRRHWKQSRILQKQMDVSSAKQEKRNSRKESEIIHSADSKSFSIFQFLRSRRADRKSNREVTTAQIAYYLNSKPTRFLKIRWPPWNFPSWRNWLLLWLQYCWWRGKCSFFLLFGSIHLLTLLLYSLFPPPVTSHLSSCTYILSILKASGRSNHSCVGSSKPLLIS